MMMKDGSDNLSTSYSYHHEQSSNASTSDREAISSTTGSTDASTGNNNLSRQELQLLAAGEGRAVRRSKAFFVFVLCCVAAAAGTLTFFFLDKEETESFASEFENLAREIGDVSYHKGGTIHGIIEGVANSITSVGAFGKADWPHFTIPHFHFRARELLLAADASFVAVSPIVRRKNAATWENYTVHNHDWLYVDPPPLPCDGDDFHEGHDHRRGLAVSGCEDDHDSHDDEHGHGNHDDHDDHGGDHHGHNHFRNLSGDVTDHHGQASDDHGREPSSRIFPISVHDQDDHVPVWQTSPTQDAEIVNYDLLDNDIFHRIYEYVIATNLPVMSEAINVQEMFGSQAPDSDGHPQSILVEPIFDEFEDHDGHDIEGHDHVVAVLIVILPWDTFFSEFLGEGAHTVHVTVQDTCGGAFSYEIAGHDARYLGSGDLHNEKYDDFEEVATFDPFPTRQDDEHEAICHYTLHIYPTEEAESEFFSNRPAVMTSAVVLIFLFTIVSFLAYDWLVQKRQKVVMDSAIKSNAIVSSLFPKEFRDRLYPTGKSVEKRQDAKRMGGLLGSLTEAPKSRLNNLLREDDLGGAQPGEFSGGFRESAPIADLFPAATVLFADIVGFTAWSSVRDPSQVFTLLETIYRAFDSIAKRRRVFKVETIGDCYVAVCGLPEACKEHPVVMARFANECLEKLALLTSKLEVALGPDTGDLTMRMGLHSGPVTAGILRGDRSRFQLFGDTVNTAARMESTGAPNRIQISSDTAELLSAAGKESWLQKRETTIVAKGKGELNTYWLVVKNRSPTADSRSISSAPGNTDSASTSSDEEKRRIQAQSLSSIRHFQVAEENALSVKTERMVGWNVDIFTRLLKQIVATRARDEAVLSQHDKLALDKLESSLGCDETTVQEEVTEFVTLPKFCKANADKVRDPNQVQLSTEVIEQLKLFIRNVAVMYNDNPFHNFEHASHVTMSVNKLLKRIVAADVTPEQKEQGQGAILADMHDRTYGITSDPLVQFAVVFSALIHDVDHRGLPNFLLVKEDLALASLYNNRSVAEQNSVDLAWERLMQPEFEALRRCIYTSPSELKRFRQTVVNIVMATDIFDKDFAQLRRQRWERCFHRENQHNSDADDVNRRAEIVLEHLIQASDVAHCMQHWQIYQKWNKRLFEEMYLAFEMGRSQTDPSENWFQSELGFFDNYIIPLAKKLRECGVFGVSSDEYLKYATDNRDEWSVRGRDIVAQSKSFVKKKIEGRGN